MSLEKPLGYILSQTKRVYRNKLMAEFRKNRIDLNIDQYILLVQIDLNEEITQQELADHLQKDKSVVMRQINALMEREYVIRSWDKTDKRKKNVELTGKGKKALEHTKTLARSVSDELLLGVNNEDQHVFERVIQRIWENGGYEEYCIK